MCGFVCVWVDLIVCADVFVCDYAWFCGCIKSFNAYKLLWLRYRILLLNAMKRNTSRYKSSLTCRQCDLTEPNWQRIYYYNNQIICKTIIVISIIILFSLKTRLIFDKFSPFLSFLLSLYRFQNLSNKKSLSNTYSEFFWVEFLPYTTNVWQALNNIFLLPRNWTCRIKVLKISS